jgi:hypothetical protein
VAKLPPAAQYAHDCTHRLRFNPCSHGWCCDRCRAVVCTDPIHEPPANPQTVIELFAAEHVKRLNKLREEGRGWS